MMSKMERARQTFVFHIGLERTGTTSFQRFCTDNSAFLQKSGILYPTRSRAFSAFSHGPLTASYLNTAKGRDFSIRTARGPKQAILRSLFAEVKKQAASTILISSEHLSSRMRTPEIEALAADFADYDCKILVIIRNHMPRFVSSYAISVMSGSFKTIDEYADEVLDESSKHFRYRQLLAPWETCFGRENLIIKPYQSRNELFQSIFDSFTGDQLELPATETYTDNKSFGPSFTEAYRLTNLARSRARRSDGSISHVQWLQSRYSEVLLKHWLMRASHSQAFEPWLLNGRLVRRLKELAVSDRQWLTDNYGVKLDATRECFRPSENEIAPDPAQILACALTHQIGMRWSLIDAFTPVMIPMKRILNRWLVSGL